MTELLIKPTCTQRIVVDPSNTQIRLKHRAALTTADPILQLQAAQLAQQFSLPYEPRPSTLDYDFILELTTAGLELRAPQATSFTNMRVDFLHASLTHRLSRASHQTEQLAKALGLNTRSHPTTLDATAGLGRDSFILAQLGCQMTLVERSPLLAALLHDGLNRGLNDSRYKHFDIKLIHGDAIDHLGALAPKNYPELIYLDPMYPQRRKSALVRKELRWLRQLVGDDQDAGNLLQIALQRAKQRVVLKRPRSATWLAGLKPHHSMACKNHRFDVYTPTTRRS